MTRLLTLMGSGETAPTMVKVHRAIFEKMGDSATPAKSLFLDTPFGFQENAAELCVKTLDYFASSIVRPLTIAGIGRIDTMSVAEREAAFSRLAQAAVIFAGPGSPTYTLKQWAPTPIRTILADKLRLGGALTFSSAAVLTLGVTTVPVYEIYKAGEDPYWLEGLNVMAEIGINAAVIPHYNNAEGGHHDTRFCYLGERRLSILEKSLASDHSDAYVLGLDEHTGVMIDLDAGSAQVVGLGVMTIRRNGTSVEIPTGTTLDLEVLIAGDTGVSSSNTSALAIGADGSASAGDTQTLEVPAGSLAEEIDRCVLGFESALSTGDANAAATQALTLDDAIEMWSKDMLQSRDPERAKAALRSMIVRLGDAAVGGLRDPRETLGPVVEVALKARLEVRAAKRFDLSDLIRDGLADCGIEVRDTPQGQTWDLKAP
jgi:cyanophycinase-like exopeptidase